MELTLTNLNSLFDKAKELNKEYVALIIDIGLTVPEVIINSKHNFDEKQEYYNVAYDELLNHKFSQGIRITGFTMGDSYAEIEHHLNHITLN